MKNLSKYLCPWVKHDENSYERHFLQKPLSFYRVWKTGQRLDKDWVHGSGKFFTTKEAAMKEADEILIESGYILLNEEQYEKLRILL